MIGTAVKRLPTGSDPSTRPMTSNKAAGFSKNLGKDPREVEAKSKILFTKREPTTKEQIIKELEKSIQKLYDESIMLNKAKCDHYQAKEKALLAYEKLMDFKSKNTDYFNTELEFGIKLNLGIIYEALKLYDEAKQIYSEIVQQDNYYTVGIQYQRVRVNLGNIYYSEGQYKKAITEWKKAMDKISKENKELRANIMRNIANAHIKMGNYTDAIDNYTESMKSNPDVRTAMNLLLCDLAVEKVEQTKNVFNLMLDVSAFGEREIDTLDENKQNIDPLKEYLIMKKKDNTNIIVNVALVMTNYLDKDPLNAFDYIIDSIKKNGCKDILNEIEMAKAMHFLKKRDVEKTIQILKSFENKNKKLISRVSNNISFLYFVEGDANNAEKYANLALENERYNHKALVNKGNIHYMKEDYLKAKEYYLEAIGVQSDCIEAIYNLGMVNIRMESIYEAVQAFEKLNSVVPNIPEVLYKIAKLYEYMKQYDEAVKYYSLLLLQIPNDPILLSSLGSLYYQINVRNDLKNISFIH
jgi:intraflagellar transport protein 88